MKNIIDMRGLRPAIIAALATVALAAAALAAAAQAQTGAGADREQALQLLERRLVAREEARRTPLYHELVTAAEGPQAALNRNRDLILVGVDDGRPRFYQTTNLNAAISVSTDDVWPGGGTGLDLTGANTVGELAVWDAGLVMASHQEFGGRVFVGDGATSVHYHANHVGGTLIAAGVYGAARGMSPAANLVSYDWSSDEIEMAGAAANGLLVSNHSYGYVAGWYYSSADTAWLWFGDTTLSEIEDAGFGIYLEDSRVWDEIAYNAPDYLIVKSAGNDRNDYGPEPGGEHLVWDGSAGEWVVSTTVRAADGTPDGFDSIPYRGTSKNILTVGAVNDVAGGWSQAADVVMSTFSGWGPTDDGRVKPDLVGNGVGLVSTYVTANDAYASLSGTSMSSPNVSGSLHVLAQQWKAGAGQAMRSATLKGLAIHTADEAGPADGPDYMFGWGLLNTAAGAEVIADHLANGGRIHENALAQGQRDTVLVYSDGSQPLWATICWNDPATTAMPWGLDQTTPMLVNDLDLRLQRVSDAVTFFPWNLDPANPAAAAVNWDNTRDNVEKNEIPVVPAGWYRVMVSHKGALTDGPQEYALIISGASSPAAPPTVSNVTFSQRTDGSGLVDVTYDLEDADTPTLAVALEASADGGATWTLVTATVSGDVGAGVAPGVGKALVWDFAADNPGVFAGNAVVRVSATD